MKNILIIAKMHLFSKEISQNRYKFLQFLDSKPNIRVIDDLPRHINKTLMKQKNSGFNVDIIIYYALSAGAKWRDIKTINFKNCNLKKYLVFEDYIYINLCSEMFENYNFNDLIIIKCDNAFISRYSEKLGKSPLLWNHFIDTEVFKERNR